MEFLLGLYTGVFSLVWWQMVICFVIFGICLVSLFCEAVEAGSFFLLVTIGLLTYLGVISWTDVSVLGVLTYVGSYLAIGCVWSLFKYKRKALSIAEYNLENYPNRTPEQTMSDIKNGIRNNTISYWIVYWPISVIKFCLDDLVDYLISKLGRVYKLIAASVVANVYAGVLQAKTTEKGPKESKERD